MQQRYPAAVEALRPEAPSSARRAPHLDGTADRIARAKRAYSVRRACLEPQDGLSLVGAIPQAGDLVLARVTQLGMHQHLESADGRRQRLWPGDEIVVAYGRRYAPDQFEATVPDDLAPCQLVAGGGVAARVLSRHASVKPATQIEPLGLLADARGVLNLQRSALGAARGRAPLTVAVLGSSMNAGKTTTAAHVIAGLKRAGLRVGAAKVTGTGAGGDRWLMQDAGASLVLDFTDMGYASTAGLAPQAIEQILLDLSGHLASTAVDCAVIEVADGILQRETAALVRSHLFAKYVDAVIFAAPDALGAIAGATWLEQAGLPLAAVSGVLTASPLAMREASAALKVPACTVDDLATPEVLCGIVPKVAELAALAQRQPR
ncbi:hypothetical protein GALL_329730 [mine drainage metagenome]|uniref:DUF1611 domain-containing protein n=1 Tax=mine drainage metagenome TaxID=410659 RepID=A0A1J5RAK7_9ZZZZ